MTPPTPRGRQPNHRYFTDYAAGISSRGQLKTSLFWKNPNIFKIEKTVPQIPMYSSLRVNSYNGQS